jgi:hypothetical protein
MPAAGFNLADQEGRNKRLAKIGDRVTVTAEHAPDVRTGVITDIERRGVTVRHDYMAVNAHGFNWSWNEFDLDPSLVGEAGRAVARPEVSDGK